MTDPIYVAPPVSTPPPTKPMDEVVAFINDKDRTTLAVMENIASTGRAFVVAITGLNALGWWLTRGFVGWVDEAYALGIALALLSMALAMAADMGTWTRPKWWKPVAYGCYASAALSAIIFLGNAFSN